MSCGIYCITNKLNHKQYVGQSIFIEGRWRKEKRIDIKSNRPIDCAIAKYGPENFYWDIIEECSPEELDKKEGFWADFLNTYVPNGYNVMMCGEKGSLRYIEQRLPDYVRSIVKLLVTRKDLNEQEIAKIVGVCNKTVSEINLGHNYRTQGFSYPLRLQNFKKGIRRTQYILKKKEVTNDEVKKFGKIPPEEKRRRDAENYIFAHYENLETFFDDLYTKGSDKLAVELGTNHTYIRRLVQKLGIAKGIRDFYNWYDSQYPTKISASRQKETKTQEYWAYVNTPVDQYDDNTYIKTWASPREAAKELGDERGSGHIREVCNGTRITAFGYKWKYHK